MTALALGQAKPPSREIDLGLQKQRADRRRSRLFVHLGLVACLCLQRFGLIVGSGGIFLCLPLFLAMLGWMLAAGYGRVRLASFAIFALFLLESLVTTLVAINVPETRYQLNTLSLFSLIAIYLCLLIEPTERFDRSGTIDLFLFYVRACAILGIAQYVAQFVGVRIFSFMMTFPALKPILLESFYNYNPIMSYGSDISRSNGFFFVEPSIFSQILALGMAVEFFIKNQLKYLPLYGLAYLVSFSGTGLLALGVSIAILTIADRRYTSRILLFIVCLAALAVGIQLLLPDLFASLANRANEGGQSGSSAYARYFAQFDFIGRYTDQVRSLIGFGPGAMERSGFFFKGSGNAALKLFIDYGIIGLILFVSFLFRSWWRRDIAIISIFSLVNFQLGGGNLLFSPLVILTTLLCVWSADPAQPQAAKSEVSA